AELADGIQTNVTVPTGSEEGDMVTVTITNPDLSTSTVEQALTQADVEAGTVAVTIPKGQIPEDGDYSVTAQITDAAGNST
ncbi:hypothetical protein KPY62_13610, partial [Psychrobacter sp. TAE2020]